MKILFIGDIVGRSGREALKTHLPDIRERLAPDIVIVNGENAAHGFGITTKICKAFLDWGVDCITTGNHIWAQRDIITHIGSEPRLLRPLNYPEGTPGKGHYVFTAASGRKILVANALGRVHMNEMNDPFTLTDTLLESYKLGRKVAAIFLDFHAEVTSETMAFGHYFDGRVSAVVGTHTHVPTSDMQIFGGGTAYQTDAGMTGDYNSVIGFKKEEPIYRFTRKMPSERFSPADGEATVCGTFIETDDKTGLALSIEPLRVGGRLQETWPSAVGAGAA